MVFGQLHTFEVCLVFECLATGQMSSPQYACMFLYLYIIYDFAELIKVKSKEVITIPLKVHRTCSGLSLVAKHSICALQYCSAQVPCALRSGAVAFLLCGEDTEESMKFHVVYGVTRNKCSQKTDVQLFVSLIRFPGTTLGRTASSSPCVSVNVALFGGLYSSKSDEGKVVPASNSLVLCSILYRKCNFWSCF